MNFSYDYEDLIRDLYAMDLDDDRTIYLIRSKEPVGYGYRPIKRIEFTDDEAGDDEVSVKSTVKDAMAEMIEVNKIL